jgi:CheY-like chemotaxis protein
MTHPEASRPVILVADDDRDTRELYRAFFDTSGCRTAEAATGSQTIASAVSIVPDVLLADYVLPDIDGLAIARRLKGDPRTAAIRILMVTGYATPELERAAAAVGIERVLLKPALPQAVMREVSRTLARPPHRKPQRLDPGLWSPLRLQDRILGAGTARREPLATRVRNEFAALPGLSLTAEQARLLFDLDRAATDRILDGLVAEGFLARTPSGAYTRLKP